MKNFLLIATLLLCRFSIVAQSLRVDSTRFIAGYEAGTGIEYATPSMDNGILFTGYTIGSPGGLIPPFPLDKSNKGNLMIGKIDSHQQI